MLNNNIPIYTIFSSTELVLVVNVNQYFLQLPHIGNM